MNKYQKYSLVDLVFVDNFLLNFEDEDNDEVKRKSFRIDVKTVNKIEVAIESANY